MRKYFLLSAVALMIATNVNAGIGAGNMQVSAEITSIDSISCRGLALAIGVPDTSKELTVTLGTNGEAQASEESIAYFNVAPAVCTTTGTFPDDISNFMVATEGPVKLLSNDKPDLSIVPTISNFTYDLSADGKEISIGGTYTFPANFEEGTYSNNLSVMYYY